ncbi:MAG TPA: hypothetical protein PLO05_07885 [Bacteroidales bacterium]|jgi:hypothetical protein|nr:hypothetical protein [Bacteroidales bacterium]MDD4235549.1 hypothetical protein [Bacteroidales bacterium]HXK82060.1 hypothetical protein [Bacteroidales bacterium]
MGRKPKKKSKSKISKEDIIKANRKGEFEANKDIRGRLRSFFYKSRKKYNRKLKHKKREE